MKTLGRTCLLEENLILVAGVTNTYRLRWLRRVSDKNGVTVVRPMDLTGWTPHMQVRRDGLTVIDLAPYTLLDTDGTITIRVPDEATQGLPAGAGAWDLLLEDPSGDVWNITDQFTTTDQFVDGSGKTLPAGTNVVAVAVTTGDTTVMKWDALTGMIDLSGYMRKTDITPASDAEIDALFA